VNRAAATAGDSTHRESHNRNRSAPRPSHHGATAVPQLSIVFARLRRTDIAARSRGHRSTTSRVTHLLDTFFGAESRNDVRTRRAAGARNLRAGRDCHGGKPWTTKLYIARRPDQIYRDGHMPASMWFLTSDRITQLASGVRQCNLLDNCHASRQPHRSLLARCPVGAAVVERLSVLTPGIDVGDGL
jgi:hypothetical protein